MLHWGVQMKTCESELPFLFIHGFLVGGTVLLWWHWWTHLSTNVLDAALDLAAARRCLGEDALDGRDAISVSEAVHLNVLQPGSWQGVLLGRHLLVQLDEQGEHAFPDLQDLRHQLGGRSWWDPACRGALGPDGLVCFGGAPVDYLLKLPPALCHEAEHLSFTKVLRKHRKQTFLYKKLQPHQLKQLFMHRYSRSATHFLWIILEELTHINNTISRWRAPYILHVKLTIQRRKK